MKVTYLGTTMLLFDNGKDQLLFDCHVTRPSILSYLFARLSTDEATVDRVIRDFRIDRLRGIFISHSHHDHVMDAPSFLTRCGGDIYGSASALNVARGGGVAEARMHDYRDGMAYQVGDYHVTVIPSVHSRAHWYNDDLGQTIDAPLRQPAWRKQYKEGGSFDFLVTCGGRRFLIRPSYNYLEGQLDGVEADVMFLGIGGISKDTPERQERFFAETLDKARPAVVIPVHWDNFFSPLYGKVRPLPRSGEDTGESMRLLAQNCARRDIRCVVQLPLTSMDY